jgi:hypothetical protein
MKLLTRIRVWLVVFVVGLVVSGVTAFPLVTETRLLAELLHAVPAPDGLVAWIDRVHAGLAATGRDHPFIAYGTDWLAFAHLVIAVALGWLLLQRGDLRLDMDRKSPRWAGGQLIAVGSGGKRAWSPQGSTGSG